MSLVNSLKQFLSENPSATDADLRNYVKSLENSTSVQSSSRHNNGHPRDSQLQLFNPFSSLMSNSLNIFDRFNYASQLMDTNFDDFDLTEFEDVKPEPTDRGYSRSKTSYVTYQNGEKKKKTVEVSQRYDDKGNMKMHKRKTVEDGKSKRVEDFYPDGTKNVSEYPQKSLENQH